MRIALYYPWIYLTSGAERTILELSGRSRHTWTLFTSHFAPEQTFPGFADRNVVDLGGMSVERKMGSVSAAGLRALTLDLPLRDYDALVVVCEGIGDLILFRNSSVPAFCICLTPLRLAFDNAYRDHAVVPQPWLKRTIIRAGAAAFRILDRQAWKRYRKIFFISEEARRRAVAGRLPQAESAEVLHVGLGFEPPAPSDRFDRYFLIPGRIMWTKNIELGIAAFRLFRESNPEFADFRLVIAGIVDRKSESYFKVLKQKADGDANIEFINFPSDEELAQLYRNAYTILFTPFNEDWGIVPLEAMAFGKPVVAVNRGGPQESIQHGIQGFLEEPAPSAFSARMAQLASDPALVRRMGRSGHQHSRLFSWERFTQRIDDEIEALTKTEGASQRQQPPPRETLLGNDITKKTFCQNGDVNAHIGFHGRPSL